MQEDRPSPGAEQSASWEPGARLLVAALAALFALGLVLGRAHRGGEPVAGKEHPPATPAISGQRGGPASQTSSPIAASPGAEPTASRETVPQDPRQTLERLIEDLRGRMDEDLHYWIEPWRMARLLLELEKRIEPGTALTLARELARLIEENDDPARPALLDTLLFYLAAEQDPVETVRVAQALPEFPPRQFALAGVLEALKTTPNAAHVETVLEQLADPALREEWELELELTRLADPEERVRLLLRESSQGTPHLDEHFGHLARLHPERAMAIFRELDSDLQSFLMNQLSRGLKQADFEQAWALAGELELGAGRASIENGLLRALARRDLDAAVKKLENFALQPRHLGLHYSIGTMLVRQDPARAMAWAEKLPPGSERMDLMNAITQNAAPHPEETLQWVENLPDPTERRRLLNTTLAVIARDNPQIAREWIAARPEMLEQKAVYLDDMFNVWAENDAVSAMQFFQEINPPHSRSYAIREIMMDLADQNPQATREFFEHLEEPQEKTKAAEAAAYTLARQNIQEAVRWAEEMEPGPPRDQVVEAIASRMKDYDPEGAILWAGTVYKESLREIMQTRYTKEWITRDPAAAKQWLEEGHLPDDQTRKMLNRANAEMKRREEAGL